MTEQEQRIAIAEKCGWKKHREIEPGEWVWVHPITSLVCGQSLVPDYLHDLNAMHLAELACLSSGNNRLNPDEGEESDWDHYIWELERIVGRGCAEEEIYAFAINSTAAQRAEAFLRTVGRWVDEKP